MGPKKAVGVSFDRVIGEERRALGKIWRARLAGTKNRKKRKHVSLALSGGGIRSATFNLGVLQALAETGILADVDYISSVSGGGYINARLIGW
jgi:predicted acylesterase/phospholipase RssA